MAHPSHNTALVEETPVILPGHDFETVTETVAEIPLSKRFPLGWVGLLLVGLGGAGMLQMALGYLVLKGIGIWGNNIPVGCLVDRHRPRRHANLGDSAAVQAAVAHVDQPLRRSDDDFRGDVRGDLPGVPHRPSVARRLLAVPVPERDGPVAAVQEPADLGRVRGFDLRHRLDRVLVHRHDSRHGDAARSRGVEGEGVDLRNPVARLARFGASLAPLRSGLADSGRPLDAAGAKA
jgi:hypothetical protein